MIFKKTILLLISTMIIFCNQATCNKNESLDASQKAIHFIKATTKVEPMIFECTAYDLSWQSCQKAPNDPWFGITADGTSLVDKSREEAMAIAVDPKVIPLGSKVLIVFDGHRNKYTGIYKAVDTGGDIKGNRIDVYFGDFKEKVSKEAMQFGRINAKVYIL